MALTDHHDVYIGSTGDGWTFVVLNRPLRNAARILTGAGFTARKHQGRTLYLLPPETAEDAHERAGRRLRAHGPHPGLRRPRLDHAPARRNPVTRARRDHPLHRPRGHRDRGHGHGQADAILVQHGFIPTGAKRQYALPSGLGERDALSSVVRAEAHLYADGISVHIDLGIATPPAPTRSAAAPAPRPTTQVHRRSH
jgi:hypothetical protein